MSTRSTYNANEAPRCDGTPVVGRTAILQASLAPGDAPTFDGMGPREVVASLLARGYEALALRGDLLDDFCDGVPLYVEDDAQFLLVAAVDLERLHSAEGDAYRHEATLGDGLLAIASRSDGATVTVTFRYFPGLDVANLVTHVALLAEDEYLWWWRSISRQLLDLIRDSTTSPGG
jgi:hypothetical protein